MKQMEIDKKIKRAYTNATPDVLASVLLECEKQKGRVIMMTEKKKTNPWIKRFASAVAVLVLVVGFAVGLNAYKVNRAVASTISLDVNPSIKIMVNKNEKILDVKALNDDGKTIMGDMDFKGNSLEITVNALIGSMLREGYINELSNSILVSVENKDIEKGMKLSTKLTEDINTLLQTDTFKGAVLGQTILSDDELEKLAKTYGITIGKAQLIQQITQKNTRYKFETLVPLTINELNLLRESNHLDLNHITIIGTASNKKFIGEEKAKEIALSHAGVKATQITKYSAEIEYEDGVMVYEIEFFIGNKEYEYDINAITGSIIKSDVDYEDDKSLENPNENLIGEGKAKQIALTHANVKASDIIKYSVKLEKEDGILVYEIEFFIGMTEYEYDINALTGAIIKSKIDIDDNKSSEKPSQKDLISETKAKEIVLAHADVKVDDIIKYSIELDEEDGILVYEIEFNVGDTEYEYEINAETGAIIKSDIDDD